MAGVADPSREGGRDLQSRDMPIYLTYFESPSPGPSRLEQALEPAKLRDHLWLVQTDQTRSQLYHRIKKQLDEDAGLLVVQIEHPPKIKHLNAGTTKWIQERFGSR